MACVWIEGFETHTHDSQLSRKYAIASGSILAASGRVFGTSGQISQTILLTPSIGATDNTVVIGWGCRLESHNASLNSGNQGLYIETGTEEQFHIELESDSGLGFRWLLKSGATTIDTSSYFDFGVWHYFEVKATVRTGVNGAYELRHNGVLEMSGSGMDMAENGTDGWDIFGFRYTSFSSGLLYDDMYILNGTGSKNNDFLDPSIVEGLLPSADGDDTQWTLDTGGVANWSQVDDSAISAPDDFSGGGINYSDTNGNRDLYEFMDLQQITGTIHAVQVGTQLAMNTPGTRTVKTKYKDPDTTLADGASHVVDSPAYDEFTEVFDDNPASATTWDVADIDDGQFGVEVVS